MPPQFDSKFGWDEYNIRIKDAIRARHEWIQSIIDHRDHHFVSCKWTVFVDSVRMARVTMMEFEDTLKAMNPDEYHFAEQARLAYP